MCLSCKIEMSDGKPVWKKDTQCQYCLACLNLCPSKAVQVSNSTTAELDRIYHPGVKARDIVEQKHLVE